MQKQASRLYYARLGYFDDNSKSVEEVKPLAFGILEKEKHGYHNVLYCFDGIELPVFGRKNTALINGNLKDGLVWVVDEEDSLSRYLEKEPYMYELIDEVVRSRRFFYDRRALINLYIDISSNDNNLLIFNIGIFLFFCSISSIKI